MFKDYENWHLIKDQINAFDSEKIFFNEDEIWWCHVGLNVGIEQDGKGEKYMRPVLIFKKFSRKMCWAIPLSTKISKGEFFFPLLAESNTIRTAIIPQLRMIDIRRLRNKIDTISKLEHDLLKKELIAFMQ